MTDGVEIRPAVDSDRMPLARLHAAVAEERDGIAAEPPVDLERRAAYWNLDWTLVANVLLVVGIVGSAIGIVAALVAFVRSVAAPSD